MRLTSCLWYWFGCRLLGRHSWVSWTAPGAFITDGGPGFTVRGFPDCGVTEYAEWSYAVRPTSQP